MTTEQAPRGEEIHLRGLREQVRQHRLQEGSRKISGTHFLEPERGRAGAARHLKDDQGPAGQAHGGQGHRQEGRSPR